MRYSMFAAAFALSTLGGLPAVQAQVVQGTVNGAQRGANEGERTGGPLGGVVGGVIGAGVGAASGAVGTAGRIVGGALDPVARPRFREYVVREHRPSFRYVQPLRVGVVLPRAGVTYYEVPGEFRARPGLRYTVVNDRAVLVDPATRQVVEVTE